MCGSNICVSILVLVDVGLRSYDGKERRFIATGVSILVLVDVGLRFQEDGGMMAGFWSFNPCFSGCRSAIMPNGQYMMTVRFQSLF